MSREAVYFDPCDLQEAKNVLKEHTVSVMVEPEVARVCPEHWSVVWAHGSMSLLSTGSCGPNTAVGTAALYVRLWLQGIDCGLARDLACSYFDRRIARTMK